MPLDRGAAASRALGSAPTGGARLVPQVDRSTGVLVLGAGLIVYAFAFSANGRSFFNGWFFNGRPVLAPGGRQLSWGDLLPALFVVAVLYVLSLVSDEAGSIALVIVLGLWALVLVGPATPLFPGASGAFSGAPAPTHTPH